jgi:UDP-glucose 4-epimerase
MTAKHAESGSAAKDAKDLVARDADGVVWRRGLGRAIAITGATSALGRRLVAELAEAQYVARVVVLDTVHPGVTGAKVSFYALDLTQPAIDARLTEVLEAERIDTFVHLSALEGPTHATAWAHELERSGTMQVLHACHKRRLSKFVAVSSTLVYGPHRDNPNFLTEEHPLRGLHGAAYVADQLDVEAQIEKWRQAHPDSAVTVLRMAPMLGPRTQNYVRRYLSRMLAPTVLGYDPLIQFVHENDALAALMTAIERDVSGIFNIASHGVMRVSAAIRLAGGLPCPVPYATLRRVAGLLWALQLCEAPAAFVSLLRHLCVADGTRAQRELGFRPRFSARETVRALRPATLSQDAKLLSEAR